MKMKKWFAVITAMLMLAVGAFAGCTDPETPPGQTETATVVLSRNEVQLDLHEQIQLTAETSGTQEKVTWSSSRTDVASVSEGLVRSVAEGSAVITASAGGASASCTVTVVDSHSAPTLSLNYQSLSLDESSEIVVQAQVLYKGSAPIDPVTLAWEIEDPAVASVTPSGDTLSATVAGESYGETVLSVSAAVYGVPLLQEIPVNVANADFVFEVDGLQPVEGGYSVRVALVESAPHTMTVTPAVTATDGGVPVTESLVWESADSRIASVTPQGAITAVSEGATQVTCTYQDSFITFYVESYRPELASDIHPVIETAVTGQLVLNDAIVGTVQSVMLGEADLLSSYTADTYTVSLNTENFPCDVSQMGDRQIVVNTDRAIYKLNAEIYTKVIRTAEDLDGMGELSKAAESDPYLWGGYFALGNDIPYNDDYTAFINTDTLAVPDWHDGTKYGFCGVFDGKGYAIEGLSLIGNMGGGLVGVLHTNGVVKNLIMTDAEVQGGNGLICTAGNGRIENVYIDCAHLGAGWQDDCRSGFFFAFHCGTDAKVINCFVNIQTVDEWNQEYTAAIGGMLEGYGTLQNVYAVGYENAVYNFSPWDPEWGDPFAEDIYGAFATRDAMKAAQIAVTAENGWDMEFWTVDEDGLPLPLSLSNAA